MEFYIECQALETGFNVKFAKKYCPESKNPEQYHKAKKYYILYHNMKFCYRRNDLTIRTLDLQREQHPPRRAHNYEKYEIVKGEYHHVRSGLCFRNLSVGPVGDHACHGCDQGSETADIYTKKQRTYRVGKAGEQDRRGDIADALAQENTCRKFMTGDQLREKSGDRRDPFHIADKDKEADECQEQKVVDPAEQGAVLYEDSSEDDEKHHRPGIDPHNAAQADKKKCQVEDKRTLFRASVRFHGSAVQRERLIFHQENGSYKQQG